MAMHHVSTICCHLHSTVRGSRAVFDVRTDGREPHDTYIVLLQFKIEPFKHPLKVDPLWGGGLSLPRLCHEYGACWLCACCVVAFQPTAEFHYIINPLRALHITAAQQRCSI